MIFSKLLISSGTREPGGGGSGGIPTCKLWERRPLPTLGCRYRSFLFLFVFARELGSLPKIVGQIRGVFSYG